MRCLGVRVTLPRSQRQSNSTALPCSVLHNMHTIQGLLQRLEASTSRFSAPADSAPRSQETRVGCEALLPLDAWYYHIRASK